MLDDSPGHEGLLDTAIDRMKADTREAERIMRLVAQAHRLLVLGELAATVAHDLNNHLSVVLSSAAHLEGRGTEPADNEAVADILRAGQRGAAMCRQVLDLVRPARTHDEPFDLNAVLRKMTPFLTRLAAAGAGPIAIDVLPSAEPAWTLGDESLFSNALVNLAINSRDAMPSGGRLTIRSVFVDTTAADGISRRNVRVDVVDTGTGIPADLIARVFDPFFTTKVGGTGLGLASVRGMVERHRGKIEVSSRVGEGTTVTIFLPLVGPR
jgi:signal transduction histidine kinase